MTEKGKGRGEQGRQGSLRENLWAAYKTGTGAKLKMNQTTISISLNLEQIQQFCDHYYIRKMSLFRSVLRDDFTEESDVDVLVEFEPEKTPGLAIIKMEDELSHIINRQVYLTKPADFSRYFRE